MTETASTDERHVDTAATRLVLIEVLDERRHQIDAHGWTPTHDDEHGVEDFAWLCARRAVEMSNAMSADVLDCRRLFVEIAAIATAAIEAIDRKADAESLDRLAMSQARALTETEDWKASGAASGL